MAYTTLKAAIQAAIKNNDNEEITGNVLQGVLLSIVNSVGDGFNFAGVATPSTNPGTPDGNMFWIGGKGTYTNFGSTIQILDGYLGVFTWNGSAFSRTSVKIGGSGGAFDVSDYTGNQYASLSAALAAVPTDVKAGGMSIKFINSGTGKYEQWRLMATSWSNTVGDWQGIDDEPIPSSINLVESGGVKKAIGNEELDWILYNSIDLSGGVGSTISAPAPTAGFAYIKHACSEGSIIFITGRGGNKGLWGFINSNNEILEWSGQNTNETNLKLVAPEGTAFVVLNAYSASYTYVKPLFSDSNSLEAEIEAEKVEISELKENLNITLNDAEVIVEFVDGKYITGSGAIAANNSYKYGTFQAHCGDIIVLNVGSAVGTCVIAKILQYNEYSRNVPLVLSTSVSNNRYIIVCDTTDLYAISGLKDSISYTVYSSMIYKDIENSGLSYAIKRIIPDFTYTENKCRTISGNIVNLNGYAYTSPYYLKKGSYIRYILDNESYLCSVVSEVYENGDFIRTIYEATGVAHNADIYIDKDGYYSFSAFRSSIANFVIIEYANGGLFFNPPLDDIFLPLESNTIPPREILRSTSFVGIVHKWGFIGDSLSSGEQAVYEDGTSVLNRFDMYEYSWGQLMCSINGVEGYNFSVGGQTTKGWCTGSGVRTWEGAQIESNWKQAYCIALGVNDRTASYPKGNANTDIDLTDYNNNADTFAGWYSGIIQRLRSVNPKCRIFCLTIPYNSQQGYLDINEIIRAIVPKFDKCYLVDLANYHWTPNILGLNDHLSPAGYLWAAWEINTYIDWIIRNHLVDFRDIAFVGTNYSADIQN